MSHTSFGRHLLTIIAFALRKVSPESFLSMMKQKEKFPLCDDRMSG